MARPVNPYNRVRGNSQWLVYEKGVDAGRAWGREEEREEWREKVRHLLGEADFVIVRVGISARKWFLAKDIEALL